MDNLFDIIEDNKKNMPDQLYMKLIEAFGCIRNYKETDKNEKEVKTLRIHNKKLIKQVKEDKEIRDSNIKLIKHLELEQNRLLETKRRDWNEFTSNIQSLESKLGKEIKCKTKYSIMYMKQYHSCCCLADHLQSLMEWKDKLEVGIEVWKKDELYNFVAKNPH